ncbi:MAG: EscU/YscU/HrcU family type III secretion system export apparatus switch protein [Gammaproteobacteria bacterium]|nr:EscU/YscU/HrcU family type III secretion system export apparatus switch protein [Gammaproteobacteria bacterium]
MTEKRKGLPSAVALQYDGRAAPRVTAKGRGKVAEHILELAAEAGVPVQEDPELTLLLAQVELGDEVPRELYVAVAQVIAFAYRLSGREPPPRADN